MNRLMRGVDMTFFVKPSRRLLLLRHDGLLKKNRRCIAYRAVASTVDHADIRGLVTASLSSVCEPVRSLGTRIAWAAAA
jgi:hypothetical protein